jgi:riboflavin kinase
MQMQETISRETYLEIISGSTQARSESLNLPDLQFFKWCGRQFGVNRGVFNTIDNWFYENGIVNVYYRRMLLLEFLKFSLEDGLGQGESKFLKFGHGGLTTKLNEFTGIRKQT